MRKPGKRNLRHSGKEKFLTERSGPTIRKRRTSGLGGGCWAMWGGMVLGGWAAGQGDPFLNLAAFLSLNKDGGWFGLLLITSNNICSVLSSKHFFSLHSGVLDNSGGKVLVQKVAGQSGYRESYSNGIQSLSLPRWRESFVVSGTPSLRGTLLTRVLG